MYYVEHGGHRADHDGRPVQRRRMPDGPPAPRCTARARSCRWAATRTVRVVIDITGPQPVVTPVDQLMSSKRQWVSATVLADGRVLATGGSRQDNTLTDVNTSAEIWNPGRRDLDRRAEVVRRARLYHSGALLLPSGSRADYSVAARRGRCRTCHCARFTILRIFIDGPAVFAPRPSSSRFPRPTPWKSASISRWASARPISAG